MFSFYSKKKPHLTSAYEVGRVLGTGNFAEVHECKRKSDGVQCAVKVIDKVKAGVVPAAVAALTPDEWQNQMQKAKKGQMAGSARNAIFDELTPPAPA